MLLIADSGSTKTDWLIKEKDGLISESYTIGFNPFFHTSDFIAQHILDNKQLKSKRDAVSKIKYYGAGCSSPDRNAIVELSLKKVFPNAKEITIAEDMLAAALATSKKEKGIVCILGTGSNSCLFDGSKIYKKVPALGYVLGDEGSGAYIGKQLLKHYLYKSLPPEIEKSIINLGFSKNDMLSKVYREPHANVFLASLTKEVAEHSDHPFLQKLIKNSFSKFASIHIQCFDDFKNIPVHFVGSIAYYFKDILTLVATDLGFTIGRIIKKPMKALAEEIHNI